MNEYNKIFEVLRQNTRVNQADYLLKFCPLWVSHLHKLGLINLWAVRRG
jgi:hypothetical protein